MRPYNLQICRLLKSPNMEVVCFGTKYNTKNEAILAYNVSLRNGVIFMLALVAWVVCLHGARASVGDVGCVQVWVAC